MKNTFILIFLSALLVTNTGIAQEIHFGAKVGANLSNVYDSEAENFNTDPKFGLATGLFLTLPLGSLVALQPEVLYSQKGFNASGSILGNNYTLTRTLNYIDVPLLLAITPGKVLSILAGPQYSYLLSSEDAFENSFLNFEQEKEFNTDNLRKNTLCLLGGFDINLKMIVFSARAGWDMYQNNGDGTTSSIRYKNVWYQATIGLRL